ncbi:hypothetical protein TNIN_305201 [Trichonephila inaurata madagascariensis]|uniref:Uncharacterized protein n=1 Tax=Trichonephila inaurata madagascariensis TaxID=2747483 RepID=A0A8X6YB84_9ARAC|nr:hypothetical protein TNIN_305201 [Trichonephila inaurata madagascariensis]
MRHLVPLWNPYQKRLVMWNQQLIILVFPNWCVISHTNEADKGPCKVLFISDNPQTLTKRVVLDEAQPAWLYLLSTVTFGDPWKCRMVLSQLLRTTSIQRLCNCLPHCVLIDSTKRKVVASFQQNMSFCTLL